MSPDQCYIHGKSNEKTRITAACSCLSPLSTPKTVSASLSSSKRECLLFKFIYNHHSVLYPSKVQNSGKFKAAFSPYCNIQFFSQPSLHQSPPFLSLSQLLGLLSPSALGNCPPHDNTANFPSTVQVHQAPTSNVYTPRYQILAEFHYRCKTNLSSFKNLCSCTP